MPYPGKVSYKEFTDAYREWDEHVEGMDQDERESAFKMLGLLYINFQSDAVHEEVNVKFLFFKASEDFWTYSMRLV